jgi:hypothetical protein
VIQPKLTINQPNDVYEQEADAMAEQVMHMGYAAGNNKTFFRPARSVVQRNCVQCEEEQKPVQRKEMNNDTSPADTSTENYVGTLSGKGKALNAEERNFFEPRFGHDFSGVQLHADAKANESAKSINALAYTQGSNIVFGADQYQPETKSGKRLIAHELTHVVQQKSMTGNAVQRTVEFRPPGRGEASAFDRRQELVDRLNRLTRAVRYSLNDRVLQHTLVEGATPNFFDTQMIGFINNAAVLPLRLITGRGLVGDSRSGFSTLLVDSFMSGYLDVDDMMRSDDTSFQMNMLHILTERSRATNYAGRIGSPGLNPLDATGAPTPEFRRAHQAGIDAETSF